MKPKFHRIAEFSCGKLIMETSSDQKWMLKVGGDIVHYSFYSLLGVSTMIGFHIGTWSVVLPTLESDFGLDYAQIGDMISLAFIGAVIAMVSIPSFVPLMGSANSLFASNLTMCILLISLGLTSLANVYWTSIIVFVWGFVFVWLMASLNMQLALIETVINQAYFGRALGILAIGAALGSLLVGYLLDLSLSTWQVLLFVEGGYIALLSPLYPLLIPYEVETHINEIRLAKHMQRAHDRSTGNPDTQNRTRIPQNNTQTSQTFQTKNDYTTTSSYGSFPQTNNNPDILENNQLSNPENRLSDSTPNTPKLGKNRRSKLSLLIRDYVTHYLLIIIPFLVGYGEGTILYWAILFFENKFTFYTSNSSILSSLGYVAFQIGISSSRFLSDYLMDLFGRKMILTVSLIFACLGSLLVTFCAVINASVLTLIFAAIGFLLCGFGDGPSYPVSLSFLADLEGFESKDTLALGTGLFLCGLSLSPLIVGNILEYTSYAVVFAMQAGAFFIAVMLSLWAKDTHNVNGKNVAEALI